MLKAFTTGFSELLKGDNLKIVGQSIVAIAVSKNLPGLIQLGVSKAGKQMDLSGPLPALASAALVSAFCYGKGMKVAGTSTLAFAGGEQALAYWNKAMAKTLDQPLVLPAIAGSESLSNGIYSPSISDDMEIIQVPDANGNMIPTQVRSEGVSDYARNLNQFSDGMSDYANSRNLQELAGTSQFASSGRIGLSDEVDLTNYSIWN